MDDRHRYVPQGLCLLALRQTLQGAGDSLLALQYLLFGLDVNDPQVTPVLEEDGVPASAVAPLEVYIGRRLRPWLRQIDSADRRATRWAEETLATLSASLAQDPDARSWALRVFRETIRDMRPEALESWRRDLGNRTWPGREAIPLLAAVGILQELLGAAISFDADSPWELRIEEGERT